MITYSDQEQEGNSAIVPLPSVTSLEFEYTIGDKFLYPYAGISIFDSTEQAFNFSKFTHFEILVRVQKPTRIPIILKQQRGKKDIHYENIVNVIPDQEFYMIPLYEFKSPEWWLKMHPDLASIPRNLSSIVAVSVQSDPTLHAGESRKLVFEKISISTNHIYPLYICLIIACLISLYEAIRYFRTTKVRVVYTPITAEKIQEKDPWYRIEQCIGSKYTTDLTLDIVQQETGIGKQKISVLINDRTSLSFKQYVNQIRLAEAERLLNTSRLTITEIAYEVGYANVTHFNRVFKEKNNMSPKQFRAGD